MTAEALLGVVDVDRRVREVPACPKSRPPNTPLEPTAEKRGGDSATPFGDTPR
jgi:hypothetical protein